jgi:hypothetical protein
VSEFLGNYWQLMVIDDFDLFGSSFSPDKANAILSVDANTVLTCAIA